MNFDNTEITKVIYAKISIDEFLTRMKGVKLNATVSAIVCKHWPQPKKYMDEAAEQRASENFSMSVGLSKKAVCVAIDRLIHACHLEKYRNKNYVQKIEKLEKLGIEIPLVIHDLIINVRNRDEHEYTDATSIEARYAIEIATLFLGWLEHLEETNSSCAVVFAGDYEGMRILQNMACLSGKEGMEFHGSPKKPYLFFDQSADTPQIKLVDPSNRLGWCLDKPDLAVDHIRQIRDVLAVSYPKERPSSFRCSTGQFDLKQVAAFMCENAKV